LADRGTSSVDFAGPTEPAGRDDRGPSDFSPPIQSPYDDLFIAHITCIFQLSRNYLQNRRQKNTIDMLHYVFLSEEAQSDMPHAYSAAVSI
jgi:hypothetical protein